MTTYLLSTLFYFRSDGCVDNESEVESRMVH